MAGAPPRAAAPAPDDTVIALKLGLRNLLRNRWRSGLTLAGVGVAVGLMVWTLAFYEGWLAEMVRGATAVETAQLQIHTAGYVERPRVYESFAVNPALLDRVRSVPGVIALSPRVELNGLVGNERRSQVARILGVDPDLEARTTPVDSAVVEGRWLASDPPPDAAREAVLGVGVAQQLRVGPGAELVVFLEAADGSLGNELLRVVGVVRTANNQIDRTAVYMRLADAQVLAALPAGVHEIAVRTADLPAAREAAKAVAAALDAHLGEPGESASVAADALVVRPWQELLPGIDEMIVLFRRSYWFMYLLIYLVAAIGILNTQRMSALERRREFGVMIAIGMRPGRLFRTVVAETLVLTMIGAALGALGGALLSWRHATAGLDLSIFADRASFSYMGVAFSERLYFELTATAVAQPVLVMAVVAVLSGLWPALRAARIEPAPTIAGRT